MCVMHLGLVAMTISICVFCSVKHTERIQIHHHLVWEGYWNNKHNRILITSLLVLSGNQRFLELKYRFPQEKQAWIKGSALVTMNSGARCSTRLGHTQPTTDNNNNSKIQVKYLVNSQDFEPQTQSWYISLGVKYAACLSTPLNHSGQSRPYRHRPAGCIIIRPSQPRFPAEVTAALPSYAPAPSDRRDKSASDVEISSVWANNPRTPAKKPTYWRLRRFHSW